jgi:hypothetical protein
VLAQFFRGCGAHLQLRHPSESTRSRHAVRAAPRQRLYPGRCAFIGC